MALGPMSTPRRSWPRSIGTPKIPTGWCVLSDKGRAARPAEIRRGLEAAVGGAPDGVDPPEVHVGLVVGEYPLVAFEPGRAGASLVGEEVSLGVEARCQHRFFERHPEVEDVYEGLQDGRGDT